MFAPCIHTSIPHSATALELIQEYADPLLQAHSSCPSGLLKALDFSQVAGLFAGMVLVGLIVDRIGRRFSSIGTAIAMLIGGAFI